MNHLSRLLGVILTGTLFISASLLSCESIDPAGWLVGTWKNETPRGVMYESWSRISDIELAGKSYALQGADTMVFETIRLICEKEQLIYVPQVTNQNEGKPVRFTSTAISENRMVFENKSHDFPQQISYNRIGSDSLVAEISGMVNGTLRSHRFSMKRVTP